MVILKIEVFSHLLGTFFDKTKLGTLLFVGPLFVGSYCWKMVYLTIQAK